jgi:hypothetical protein
VAIALADGARIDANGQIGGIDMSGPSPLSGGGAGGGILLEAPIVSLGADARLLVNGGPAATGEVFNPALSVTTAPSPGGTCTSGGSIQCGDGGNGAGLDGPATNGENVPYTTSPSVTDLVAAGGGGGLGFIRINTALGEHTKSSSAIESGVVTEGAVRTR